MPPNNQRVRDAAQPRLTSERLDDGRRVYIEYDQQLKPRAWIAGRPVDVTQ